MSKGRRLPLKIFKHTAMQVNMLQAFVFRRPPRFSKAIALSIIGFVSCNLLLSCYTPRYVYSPAAHNVPVLTQKNDSKIALNYSSNISGSINEDSKGVPACSNGFDLQAAHAISNKFAFQINYFTRSETNGGNYSSFRDSSTIRYKRNLIEIGAGYYSRLQPGGNLFFQVFAGVGFGDFKFSDNGKDINQQLYSRFHQSGITKFYIQPAIQYNDKKLVVASLSSRFTLINFGNVETDYSPQEQSNYKLDDLLGKPVFFWEPAFINSFGFKKIPGFSLEYQFGLSLLLNRRFIDARAFNFSAGLLFDLPLMFKKKPIAKEQN